MIPPTSTEYGRTLGQQARRLGISPATVYRMIRYRDLPATLVSGRWFVRDQDIDQYCRECTAARRKKPAPIDLKAHDAADVALTEAGW
jgi:excisionase family DNA binding protein